MMYLPVQTAISFILLISIQSSKVSAGRFWHIADLHYDPNLDLRRSCVKPVDEIPEWGTEFCDAKLKLINSSIEALKRIEPNPQFMIWTGDTVLHYLNGTEGTKEEIVDIVEQISRIIDYHFPSTKVIASLGNHDFVPDNQLPASENEIYRNISAVWKELGWFDGEISDSNSFQNYGFYTVSVETGLVAIAMNTNLYYRDNKVFESEEIEDPGNQFQVLEDLLKSAKSDSSKVLITAHVPFGVGAMGRYIHMYEKYNAKFVSLVQKYHDVIAGLFFGHEHDDSLKIISDKEGKAVAVASLAPSVSPWTYISPEKVASPYHNPAVLLLDYNKSQNIITERTQYSFNLREANSGRGSQWKESYKFTTRFNVPDVSVSSVVKVLELSFHRGKEGSFRCWMSNSTVSIAPVVQKLSNIEHFQDYLRQYYSKQTLEDVNCDEDCRNGMLCAIKEVELDKVTECLKKSSPNSASSVEVKSKLALLCVTTMIFILSL